MDPIMLGLLVGAGSGLLKSQLIDKPAAQRNTALNAELAKMSPWSTTKPDLGTMQAMQNAANPFSAMLQFGGAGALMGQGYDQAQNAKGLNDAIVNAGTGNYGGPASTPDVSSNTTMGGIVDPSANPYLQKQDVMQNGGSMPGTAGTTSPKMLQKYYDGWMPSPAPSQMPFSWGY